MENISVKYLFLESFCLFEKKFWKIVNICHFVKRKIELLFHSLGGLMCQGTSDFFDASTPTSTTQSIRRVIIYLGSLLRLPVWQNLWWMPFSQHPGSILIGAPIPFFVLLNTINVSTHFFVVIFLFFYLFFFFTFFLF